MLQKTLLEERHEVLLISFRRQYPQWLFPGKSDKDPSASPLRAVNPRYWLDSINPISWIASFRKIRRYQPDVIVLQWWTTFWAPLWLTLTFLNRWLLKRPIAIICHNVLPHEPRMLDKFLARLVLGQAQRLIVQSTMEKNRLLSLKPDADVVVVPHPVYDMFADKRVPKHEARAELDLPPNIPILLFFGIVREYKGLRILLEAMPAIQKELGPVLLVVAGEFWEDKASYFHLIRELGIQKIVRIDDRYIPDEQVALYFSAADVLVAPYTNVTGSGVVQMAHGFGLPVVGGDTGEDYSTLTAARHLAPSNQVEIFAKTVVDFLINEHPTSAYFLPTSVETRDGWVQLANSLLGCSRSSQAAQ
jgi:glycosyltransferase involved in cell wall biosynthesis